MSRQLSLKSKIFQMSKIYLDNNATTRVDARVADAIIEELEAGYGNPSSIHSFGQEARNRLTKARRQVARYFGFKPTEVLFTSSATEAVNLVVRGTDGAIITSTCEHACVYATVKSEEEKGRPVTYLNPGPIGAVTPEQIEESITAKTGLIVLMAANNETGVKTDIFAIAEIAERHQIPFFVDAVAWVGKEPFIPPSGVMAMTISGHKFHAPKGVGALLMRSSFKPSPLLLGGAQEYNKRAGTENMIGIAALAKAVELLNEELPQATERMRFLRDRFETGILNALPNVVINGDGERIVNTSNLSFEGVEGESILLGCDLAGLAVSHGSACSSGSLEPSRILMGMGHGKDRVRSSIRFSLSRFTTEEEIDRAIDIVIKVINSISS